MGNPNSTLAAIRARLAQAEQKKGQNFDNSFFPFWNAKNDSTSELRFLPDGNQDNTYFWVEKLQIKLPFNGIKGGDTKPVTVSVPCVEMFGRELYPQGCPILSEVRAWYKEAKASGESKDGPLTQKANTYWKKPQYIMQGFVRKNAVAEDTTPENPIRKFSLNKQLFNLVKAGLMDAEMINLPCDYENGSDFRITKTSKGQYADYGTSSYARRESALTQAELDAIEKHGLSNLSDFLGKKPTAEELVIIREMFEASVDGEAYDQERWGNFYRPAGVKADKEGNSDAPQTEAKGDPIGKKETKETSTSSHAETESVAAPAGDNKSASAILEMIKARGKKTAEAKAESKA
jgi:hypothetical protein